MLIYEFFLLPNNKTIKGIPTPAIINQRGSPNLLEIGPANNNPRGMATETIV